MKAILIISMCLFCAGCDFTPLPNDNNITIPENLKRIADSLEKIAAHLEKTKESDE